MGPTLVLLNVPCLLKPGGTISSYLSLFLLSFSGGIGADAWLWICLGATRSGAAFSSYGGPIQIAPQRPFCLHERLQAEDAKHRAKEDVGLSYNSDDEVELEDPPAACPADTEAPVERVANPEAPVPAAWAGLSAKERKKHLKKRAKRAVEAHPAVDIKRIAAKRVAQLIPLRTKLSTESLPVASSGWVGSRPACVDAAYSLEELLGPKYGMKVVDWDGRSVSYLLPFPQH